MRRFSRLSFPNLIVFFAACVFFIQGCARPVLHIYPASIQEIEAVREAFALYHVRSEKVCPCCLDAEADAEVSVSGWFKDYRGKISGYLQTMEPGFIKFVAINPLGQPVFIFGTDGKIFKSLNVFERRADLGSVHSETYRKLAPPGFEPELSYYWLTGRLPPGELQIVEVARDREQDAFWLQIRHADTKTDSMVLFDPAAFVILRHVLRDEQGKHMVDVLYENHAPVPGTMNLDNGDDQGAFFPAAAEKDQCRLPAEITVKFRAGAETIKLELRSLLDDVHFSAADFFLNIPDDFNQHYVQ